MFIDGEMPSLSLQHLILAPAHKTIDITSASENINVFGTTFIWATSNFNSLK
jgi:hypothetical protein